jgi:hypothetical protein
MSHEENTDSAVSRYATDGPTKCIICGAEMTCDDYKYCRIWKCSGCSYRVRVSVGGTE